MQAAADAWMHLDRDTVVRFMDFLCEELPRLGAAGYGRQAAGVLIERRPTATPDARTHAMADQFERATERLRAGDLVREHCRP